MTTTIRTPEPAYYDIHDDWPLIEASFSKQYGIRLREKYDMPFSEFQELLSGLMHDTPLGNIIAIRSETDKEVIKNFTPQQRKERAKWINKAANEKLNDTEYLDKVFLSFEKGFEKAFS